MYPTLLMLKKGEIDAYKQMYKDGLLSASETSALINKKRLWQDN